MNSEFKEVLKEFCKANDIVVGAPAIVFFEGEHAVLHGGIALVQQLPLHVYVGLKRDDKIREARHPIRIPQERGYHTVWLPHTGETPFHDFKLIKGSVEWPLRTQIIENLVNDLLIRDSIRDFIELDSLPLTVSILCNFRSGAGCNFSGSFSVALLTAIRLAAEAFGTVSNRVFSEQYITQDQNGLYSLDWNGKFLDLLDDWESDLHRLSRIASVYIIQAQ